MLCAQSMSSGVVLDAYVEMSSKMNASREYEESFANKRRMKNLLITCFNKRRPHSGSDVALLMGSPCVCDGVRGANSFYPRSASRLTWLLKALSTRKHRKGTQTFTNSATSATGHRSSQHKDRGTEDRRGEAEDSADMLPVGEGTDSALTLPSHWVKPGLRRCRTTSTSCSPRDQDVTEFTKTKEDGFRSGNDGDDEGGGGERRQQEGVERLSDEILLRTDDPSSVLLRDDVARALQEGHVPLYLAFDVLQIYHVHGARTVTVREFCDGCSRIGGEASGRQLLDLEVFLHRRLRRIDSLLSRLCMTNNTPCNHPTRLRRPLQHKVRHEPNRSHRNSHDSRYTCGTKSDLEGPPHRAGGEGAGKSLHTKEQHEQTGLGEAGGYESREDRQDGRDTGVEGGDTQKLWWWMKSFEF
eukprot:GHVQ01023901.1.p1 GENE.GHVQ01023901.1~~GHVQ01023901.1.p1  ORF type:complete len:413 (-),score=62.31 GHVQ01023901.1:693-1931(-)